MHNVLDGINALRRILSRTWIDEGRCERGLEALRAYRRQWDERLKDWKMNPLHDWSSHGADALRMFAAGFDEPVAAPREPEGRHRRGWRAILGSPWGRDPAPLRAAHLTRMVYSSDSMRRIIGVRAMRTFIGLVVLLAAIVVADFVFYDGHYSLKSIAAAQYYGTRVEQEVSFWFHRLGL